MKEMELTMPVDVSAALHIPAEKVMGECFLFGWIWIGSRYSQLHLPVTVAQLLYETIKEGSVEMEGIKTVPSHD